MPRPASALIAGRRCFPAATSCTGFKGETNGIYAASLAKPGAAGAAVDCGRQRAVRAPGSDGKDYWLWARGGTLVAQEFDPDTFKLAGETHAVATIRWL